MKESHQLSPKIPRTIWILGFVSLLMDLSSELIHSLLPIYLSSVMGISVLAIGIIEGIAEATAQIVKVFSGAVSDWFRKRKTLIFIGYGLAALTKPLFPLAQNAETVFTARFLDRIGKGIRGAPRDALITEVSPPEIRGACFGLRQSMDTVGAFLGPLLAVLLMFVCSSDIKSVLWFATIPAFLVVLLIVIGVEDVPAPADAPRRQNPVSLQLVRSLPSTYWYVVILGVLFGLARFSEAFLVLRAAELGFKPLYVPLVMGMMALFFTLSAYPAGRLADRMSAYSLLAFSLLLLIVADLILGYWDNTTGLLVGVAVWGLHMGFSQGLLSKLVADHAPSAFKATAFGVFNLATGVALLLASVIAGVVWQWYGAAFTFYVGAAFSVVTLLFLLATMKGKNTNSIVN